jgi:hypothetical protein
LYLWKAARAKDKMRQNCRFCFFRLHSSPARIAEVCPTCSKIIHPEEVEAEHKEFMQTNVFSKTSDNKMKLDRIDKYRGMK